MLVFHENTDQCWEVSNNSIAIFSSKEMFKLIQTVRNTHPSISVSNFWDSFSLKKWKSGILRNHRQKITALSTEGWNACSLSPVENIFFHQHTNISFNNKNMVALSWNKWVETVDKQKFCHLHQNATTMLGSGFCLKNLAKFLKKKKDMKMTEEEKLLNYTSWSNPSMYCPPSLEYPSSSSHWIPSINFEAANHELLFPDKGRADVDRRSH